jgi:hypothetical protein
MHVDNFKDIQSSQETRRFQFRIILNAHAFRTYKNLVAAGFPRVNALAWLESSNTLGQMVSISLEKALWTSFLTVDLVNLKRRRSPMF